MKILITGASGLLGRQVLELCRQQGHIVKALAFTRSDPQEGLEKLDLTDTSALSDCIHRFQPDAIIHTAAERRPDVVERDPQASNAINVDVPTNLSRIAADLPNVPLLINVSTDYVFDGSKPPYKVDDQPNPLNAYGVSKLQGERALLQNAKRGCFTNLRVPVLYGKAESNDESAVNILLDAIKPPTNPSGPRKKCDAYCVRYPTNVSDVSKALLELCTAFTPDSPNMPPITHFSAKEAMTKYDMCNVLSRVSNGVGFDTSTSHLDPEFEADPLATTTRPRHCKLDTAVIEDLGISVQCVSFEDWWRAYLEEKMILQREQDARKAAEEEARKKREEEEAEERRKREEEEAKERRKKEEEEAEEEERRRREQEEAEERRRKEEQEVEETDARKVAEKVDEDSRQKNANAEKMIDDEPRAKDTLDEEATDKDQEAGTAAEIEAPQDTRAHVPMGVSNETGNDDRTLVESHKTIDETLADSRKEDHHAAVDTGLRQNPSDRSVSPNSLPPLMSPGSPNPSFSSLRARPTPPATSGHGSPTSSIAPALYGRRSSSPYVDEPPNEEAAVATGENQSSSTLLASTPTPSSTLLADPSGPTSSEKQMDAGPVESPLRLTNSAEGPSNRPQHFGHASSATQIALDGGRGLFQDHPAAAAAATVAGRANGGLADADGDNDSDGYGQPSPRNAMPSDFDGRRSLDGSSHTLERGSSGVSGSNAFSAGFGEVRYGLDNSLHADQTLSAPPVGGTRSSFYHQSSFDESNRQREPEENTRKTIKKWQFSVRVGDPQKVGDPVTAHIVYTVRTTTNSPHFRGQQFSVLRRYKDFRWLHAALVANNPGIIVPPVPEKVVLGRFAAELVEARRHGLETCINKIAQHPALQEDEDFKLFLESDQFSVDVKARDLRKGPVTTPEQKTYFSWGSSINGPKFHEFDEWFDNQKAYLDSLESQLKLVVKSISAVAQQRKELCSSLSDFGNIAMTLSGSSLSRSLSTCFAGLGELEKRITELNEKQAEADVRQVGTVMYEYERVVGSVRKAFATRQDAWINWIKADEELRKHRAKHEKLKREPSSSHSERLKHSISDLAELESKSLNLKREFDTISSRCKSEMDRLDEERVEDFIGCLERWLRGMIQRQNEIIQEWQVYIALLQRQTGVNTDST